MKQITGSILIGGKSSRMGGGIKGLKKFNNKTIFDRIYERAKNQVSSLIINSNVFSNELTKYQLPICPDIIKGHLFKRSADRRPVEQILNEFCLKFCISK